MGHLAGFFQDPAPQLVVEKMNFSRHAYADFCVGFSDGQSPGGEIWRVADLTRDLQDSLARGIVDSGSSVQRPIHRSDRNVGQLRNQVNTASFLSHGKTPASNQSNKYALEPF